MRLVGAVLLICFITWFAKWMIENDCLIFGSILFAFIMGVVIYLVGTNTGCEPQELFI